MISGDRPSASAAVASCERGAKQAPRGEHRDRGDKKRAEEYGSERLRQPSARRPAARLNRQPAAIVEIDADQEGRAATTGPRRSEEVRS